MCGRGEHGQSILSVYLFLFSFLGNILRHCRSNAIEYLHQFHRSAYEGKGIAPNAQTRARQPGHRSNTLDNHATHSSFPLTSHQTPTTLSVRLLAPVLPRLFLGGRGSLTVGGPPPIPIRAVRVVPRRRARTSAQYCFPTRSAVVFVVICIDLVDCSLDSAARWILLERPGG